MPVHCMATDIVFELLQGADDLIKKVLPNEDFWGSVVELEVYLRRNFFGCFV